jgi:hypothetical protein
VIATDPVKRLHEPFPATRPASRKDSVAFPPGSAGVPARSVSTHSVPGRDICETVGFEVPAAGLFVEAHDATKSTVTPNDKEAERCLTKVPPELHLNPPQHMEMNIKRSSSILGRVRFIFK